MPVRARFLPDRARVAVMKIERHLAERGKALGVGVLEEAALPFMLDELLALVVGPVWLVRRRDVEAENLRWLQEPERDAFKATRRFKRPKIREDWMLASCARRAFQPFFVGSGSPSHWIVSTKILWLSGR